MKLIVLQSSQLNECLAFAQRLQQAGYQHFDLTWQAKRRRIEPGLTSRRRYLEAKRVCLREAHRTIQQGHSVVISTDYFRSSDREKFESRYCQVEVLTIEGDSYALVLSRLHSLVVEPVLAAGLTRIIVPFLRLRGTIQRSLLWN